MLAWLLAAIAIRMLALPPHATIDPFGPRALIRVSSTGDVTATATVDGFLTRELLWRRGTFRPSSVTRAPAIVSHRFP
jgi:hypothetical protein